MFAHIFVNRLKCLVRDKQMLFWTFLYPIVLGTLFGVAFTNISNGVGFSDIPIAVVSNAEYQSNAAFKSALASVSDENSSDKLFSVTEQPLKQAEESLKNGDIEGYILFDGGAHVVVKDSGINQTILKEFMDSYVQTGSAYAAIAKMNPGGAAGIEPADRNFLSPVSPGKANADNMVVYFYALIAMACLFGGFWGVKEIEDIQADLSARGARVNLAPVHKLKAFGISLCAAVLVDFLSLLALVAYLRIVMNVDFGGQIGYVIATCFAGSLVGVSLGAFLTALFKGSSQLKTAVMITVNIVMSFLAGMMVADIKYTVTQAVPIMAYINPANLISDALYSLYYYSSHARFFLNFALLIGFALVFYICVYLVIRRQKYASI